MLKIDEFLYNKLIIACQELKPCKYAYYKLINTLASLINNLQSFITIYKALNLLSNA
jgi:hypothetical protein